MSIKNFFVKVKGVKSADNGMVNLLRYLKDEKRHSNGIVNFKELSDERRFFLNVHKNVNGYNVLKKLNGVKGRNISSWGDSYIFSFPKDIKMDKTEMGKVVNQLLVNLWKQFNKQLEEEESEISFSDFIKNVFINIHNDEHIHMNVVFSRVMVVIDKEMGKPYYYNNRITNRKKFLSVSKGIFNKIILENFNLSIDDYETKTNFKKGYKSQYIKEQMNELDKKITELKKLKEETANKVLELDDFIKMRRKERKEEISKLIEENERKEKLVNSFHLMIRYFSNFMDKIEKNELKGLVGDYNKIMDKIEEIENNTKNEYLRQISNEVKRKTKKYYGVKM